MKTDGQRQDLNEQWTWLRSPITADGSVALVGKIGNLGTIGCVGTNGALRPAFWVDISSVEPSE